MTLNSQTPATCLIYCEQAKGLLDALSEAIHQLINLHAEQFQSILGDDLESSRFDDLIHLANERKHEAKYAYLNHLETHGCSTWVPMEPGILSEGLTS